MWTQQRNLFYLAMVSIAISSSASAESLQRPNISLTSPDGARVWGPNAHAKITKGHSFVFTCFVNFSNATGRFILTFSGSRISESNVSLTANFSFPVAEYEHQGNYSCVYNVTLRSGNVTSAESATIHVVITFPWLLLVYSAVPAVLLMLLVLLVICLVCRRRRRAKRSEGHAQLRITVTNLYEDDDDEEEDEEEEEEERDYVNVEPVDRKQTEEMEEVDEAETDDYENMENEDNYIAGTQLSARKRDRGDEDTDETSDDESDYVNIAKLF